MFDIFGSHYRNVLNYRRDRFIDWLNAPPALTMIGNWVRYLAIGRRNRSLRSRVTELSSKALLFTRPLAFRS